MRKSAINFGISRPVRMSVFLLSVRMGQFGPHWTNFSWKCIIETFIKIWLQKSRFVKVVLDIRHFTCRPKYVCGNIPLISYRHKKKNEIML